MKELIYPCECDFCEQTFECEKELKMHLKTCHAVRDASFICGDCDFIGGNEPTVSVHHGKVHNSDYECGLCDFKAKSLRKLETHLSTCEMYECDDCYFRVKKLSDIGSHMKERHSDENLNIIHLKLDRKDEDVITLTEHLRNELFENESN